MTEPGRDGNMRIVVRALTFTALVLVMVGVILLFTSRQPLIGALVVGIGLVDAIMAYGLSHRRS